MADPFLRVLLGIVLGFGLLVAGYGSTAVAHQWNQACHEKWDGTDADVDCEDAVHVLMLYGGALVGTFGVALLGAAGYERWSAADEGPTAPHR